MEWRFMSGHVFTGILFCTLGLLHIMKHSKLHTQNPKSFTSLPWFPSPRLRHLELFILMTCCVADISSELLIGLPHDRILDPDGSIPSATLPHLEHSSMALVFLVYLVLSFALDRLDPPAKHALTNITLSVTYALELLNLHFHSTDHVGIAGRFHSLLQLAVAVCLCTSVLVAAGPHSFLFAFARSAAMLFQGVWLVNMGVVLGTPALVPKGCAIHSGPDFFRVGCEGDEALKRAKGLANIQFTYWAVFVWVMVVAVYVLVSRMYDPTRFRYDSVSCNDVEAQEKKKKKRDDVGLASVPTCTTVKSGYTEGSFD